MSEIEKSMKQTIDRIWSEGRMAGLSDFDIIQMIETMIQEKLRAERTRPKKKYNYTPMTDEEIDAAKRNISEPPTPSKEPEYEVVERIPQPEPELYAPPLYRTETVEKKKKPSEPEYEVVERIPQPEPELYAPPIYTTEKVERKKRPSEPEYEVVTRIPRPEPELYAPPIYTTETVERKKRPGGEVIEKRVRMVPSEEVLYAPPQVVTEYSIQMPELLYAPPTLELYEMFEDDPNEDGNDSKGNGGPAKK